MNRLISFLSLIAFMAVMSCGGSKKLVVQEKLLDTVRVSATGNPLDIYRSSEPRYWDITHTRVALSFNFQERTADGRAWIDIHPYAYKTDSLVLDAKDMTIDSVLLTGSSRTSLSYQYRNNEKLVIKFGRPYDVGDTAHVYIRYTARPYANSNTGSDAISEDRGLYFINPDKAIPNKPVQIWTQGESQSNSHWLPTLDQPNERFTVQTELTVPDTFKTLGNGYLAESTPKGPGLRQDTWIIDQAIQTYAIMFAIGKFDIVYDKPWQGKEVSYYVEPAYAPYAKLMFKNTTEMMDYFSTVTGIPYPWSKYSQVVVRDYVSGAMENTSASLFGEFMNQNAREIADKDYEDIVSHELFHQWFGDYVTAESWSNVTLNESFANYGEQLWRKYKYGKASVDELAYADLMKYVSSAEADSPPLVRFYYEDREDMFDRISYEKGGAILNYLHGLIGDRAFFSAMNSYLKQNALNSAEAPQWRIAVEQATGLDWNWFFDQWYYRGGHPVLKLDYSFDDKAKELVVKTSQVQDDSSFSYVLPLKAILIYGNSKETIDWNINRRRQTFRYPYKNGSRPVFVPDSEHWLAGEIKEDKSPADWLVQLENLPDYINKRKAVSGAYSNATDSVSRRIFQTALADSLDAIRMHALNLLAKAADKTKWTPFFEEKIKSMILSERSTRVKAAAFDLAGRWKLTDTRPYMLSALSDSSYKVAGAALQALRKISKDTAYILAKQLINQDPQADLESAIWSVVANQGEPADTLLFGRRAAYVYGGQKMAFGGYLNLYALTTKNDLAFGKSLRLLVDMVKNENIKSYRLGLGSMVVRAEFYYKQEAESIDKDRADRGKRRLPEVRKYKTLLLESEKDPENLRYYKEMENAN